MRNLFNALYKDRPIPSYRHRTTEQVNNKEETTVVLAANNQTDIMESFTKVYDNLHQQLTVIQITTHGAAKEVTRHYEVVLNSTTNVIKQIQKELQNKIIDEIHKILMKLNITIPEKSHLQNCLANSQNETEEMILMSKANIKVCQLNAEQQLDQINIFLRELYAKHEMEHQYTDKTREYCKSTSQNQYQLYTCLYNQLYIGQTKTITHLKEESESALTKYYHVYDKAGKNIMKCSNQHLQKMYADADQILHKFETCGNNTVQHDTQVSEY